MKKILLLVMMTLCFSHYALSQESFPQRAVIIQAFNRKNIALLDNYISPDCAILGKSGSDFRSTCEALFARLSNDTIVDMTLLSAEKLEGGVTSYTCNITYSGLGKKKGIFNVNNDGKISRLDYLSGAGVVTSTDVRHVMAPSVKAASKPLIKIPFRLGDNNLIVFKGELNGAMKNFIFDSGAMHSFINSTRLNRSLRFGKAVLKGVNSASKTELAVADSIDIDISGIALKNASILARDLSYLESADTEIAAVIGMDILGSYDIIYDYDKCELTLISPQANVRFSASSVTTIPYANLASGFLPCIKAEIDGKELVFAIDCGAATNLISPSYESLATDIQETKLIGITGDASKIKKGKISFDVAGLKFDQQVFVIKDISHLGLNIDGLLGYQFLKTRKMMFKNSTKELIIF